MRKDERLQQTGSEAPEQPARETVQGSRKIPVRGIFLRLIAALLIAMVSFSAAYATLHARYAGAAGGGPDTKLLTVVGRLIEKGTVFEADENAMMEAAVHAYVAALGDPYARYYPAEEYAANTQERLAQGVGIGITVRQVKAQIPYEGQTYTNFLDVVHVVPDSPAEKAGVRDGDLIHLMTEEKISAEGKTREELMAYLRGEEGKTLTFFVLRQVQGSWRSIRVDVVPGPYTTYSVFGTVSETDPTVGIVTVTGFDMETPAQFDRTMDALLEAGCTRFVFDLRNNPGGNLRSIVAVLARLLQEGDRILTMTDADGTVTWEECRVDRQTGSYAGCSVTREDIGKYRGYACAVVTNRGTASAAEVFTACLRDYDLAVTVGETTYGKGCMQTTINLKPYGLEGALKLTDRYYTPPCGESYEGIGIQPDLPVEDDTARYERPAVLQTEADDPQLYAAIDAVRNGN